MLRCCQCGTAARIGIDSSKLSPHCWS
jgi:hypothetical protein